MNENDIRVLISQMLSSNDINNQFALPEVPFHVHNGNDAPQININNIDTTNLPTSSTNLSSGSLWNNSGVLTIVP